MMARDPLDDTFLRRAHNWVVLRLYDLAHWLEYHRP